MNEKCPNCKIGILTAGGRCLICDPIMPRPETAPTSEETVPAPARGWLPRRPWVASCQYGSLKFILSQDNEILWRVPKWLPMETLRAMVAAANDQLAANIVLDRTPKE